jgi:hypothetical protein
VRCGRLDRHLRRVELRDRLVGEDPELLARLLRDRDFVDTQ